MTNLGPKSKLAIVLTIALAYTIAVNYVCNSSIALRTKDSLVFTRAAFGAMPNLSAAPIAVNDSNWAGYIIASDLQNPQSIVTNVNASWTVPSVVPSIPNDTFSAIWIGIGGFFDNTLIQTGTEQESIGGQAIYSAWYELLPQFSVTIGSVSPGDQINASIQLVNSNTETWQISIQDLTSNQTFQNYFNYAASRLSDEWIVERPEIGRRGATLAALADIGSVAINNCVATVGTQNGSISTFPGVQSIMYDIIQNTTGTTQLTTVSKLSTDGASFTVDTSPAVVPELVGWKVLPLTAGTSLLAFALKKRWHRNSKVVESNLP